LGSSAIAFEDGRIMKAIADNPKCQNFVDQQLVNFKAADLFKTQATIALTFGELYGEMFTAEELRKKVHFFKQKPTEEELKALKK
jgi:hypothetical protein